MSKEVIYFPGLNGIRAIAAVLVVIFHTDQWSHYFGIESIGFWQTEMHSYAVVLFFVLSGFLITFLLLKEKEQYGKINYLKFYTRRILRIWPVYYTVLFVGTFLLVAFQFWTPRNLPMTFLFHFFLMPNLVFTMGFKAELIGILWSVGVEEQFYAFWPFLLNKSKKIIRTLLIFLGVYMTAKVILSLNMNHIKFIEHLNFIPFDLMATGAVAAWLFHAKSKLLKIFYHPIVQVGAWGFLLVSVFYQPIHIQFLRSLDRNYHAVVYAIIILNVSTNKNTIIKLENKMFDFLGKISYGIYAYHFIVLFLVSLAARKVLPYIHYDWLQKTIMFTSVLAASIFISYLSYRYLESWFLNKKKKYMLVQSRNEASDNSDSSGVSIEDESKQQVKVIVSNPKKSNISR